MFLSDVAIKRPVFTLMVVGAIIVFGMVSVFEMGVDLFPDIDFPMITVTTVLRGASPDTVESEVTEPLEESINTISGIKSLQSISSEGYSQIMVEFELERDVDLARQDVSDKVSRMVEELPTDAEAPVIEKMDFDAAPIIKLALSGERDLKSLTDFAENVLKTRIETVNGVGGVKIVGGRERTIRIWIDPDRLKAYHLTVQDIIRQLTIQNVERPGGKIENETMEIIVKTEGEVATPREFGDIIIAKRNGALIKIKDIGHVEDGVEEATSLSRLNGTPAVSLLIRRQSGTNMVRVAKAVKEEILKMTSGLPRDMNLVITQDLSVFVRQSMKDVRADLALGAILAILVVFAFLRSLRSTLIIACILPGSLIGAFTLMRILGFTINNLTMLALSLSVGLLIDDAIVVLENSFRHLESGEDVKTAARNGIREIGFAVLATSLTLNSVFVPVAFMKGIVGRFFFQFGLTVAFLIIISTFLAFTFTPMLCSLFMKLGTSRSRVGERFENAISGLRSVYTRLLNVSLRHRWMTVGVACVIFMFSLFISRFLESEFIPEQDRSEFLVLVKNPSGFSLEHTSKVMKSVEERIARFPGVKDLFVTIAGGTLAKANEGTVLVKMTPKASRKFSQTDLMEALRKDLGQPELVTFAIGEVEQEGGGSAAIEYSIRGPDLEVLNKKAEEVLEELRANYPGLVDLDTSSEKSKPELRLYIDRDRASDLQVSVEDIAMTVQAIIGGLEVTDFEDKGEKYDVKVRALPENRDDPSSVDNLSVRSHTDQLIDFRNVITMKQELGPTQIEREDRQRKVTVLANLAQGTKLGTGKKYIEDAMNKIPLPIGYETDFTGMVEIMQESFGYMFFSLFLAVILIYMVLASQFESFFHPFTIMLSLPLSIVGALGLLLITGQSLSILSMIGIIMLMGVVTKNAILLVDYTNTLRKEGLSKDDALRKACPIRLRPILMTTISTILGMLPIALSRGEGAEIRVPMAICIIGGLLTSTLLTLVIVPVVYSLVDDFQKKLAGLFRHEKKTVPEQST